MSDNGQSGHHPSSRQSIHPCIHRSNHPIHRSIHQTINQSIDSSIDPSIRQTINQSFNPSIKQSISRLSANSRQNPSPYPSPGTQNPIHFAFLVGGRWSKKGAKGTQSLQYATPQPPNNENSLPKRSPRRQNALQDTKMTAKGLHHCCRDPIKPEGTSPNRKAPNPCDESYITMAL